MKMKFKTGNHVNINNTSYMGLVWTTYDHISSVLGFPTRKDDGDDKVTCEWDIEFEDGSVATIYDWKTDRTPKGLYDWHIGGHEKEIVAKVENLLKTPARLSKW